MTTPLTPTSREAFDRVLFDLRCTMHTCFPAQVLAYDADAQVVDLRPALQREVPSDDPEVDWAFESLPDLLSVQVMWGRAGSYALTFPIKPGDWMLVLCAEQTTSRWRTRASAPTNPGVNDAFGLNGCVALPGWFPDAKKLSGVSAQDLVLGNVESDATVRIKPNGDVVLGGESGAGLVALADKVDQLFKTFTTTAVGSADGGLALQTAVKATYAEMSNTVAAAKVKAR